MPWALRMEEKDIRLDVGQEDQRGDDHISQCERIVAL